MKKFILFFVSSLVLHFTQAQISETEPNDNFSQANPVPPNTILSGVTCGTPQQDFFQIILPADGNLKIVTSVGASDPSPVNLTVSLYSKNQNLFYDQPVASGSNGVPVNDTIYFGCLIADTFYLKVYSGFVFTYCYNYQFSYEVLPSVFGNDIEPNNSLATAIFLPVNTHTEGHLSYRTNPGALLEDDFYKIIPPTDGVLRIVTQAVVPGGPMPPLALSIVAKNSANFGDYYPSIGTFNIPAVDTFYYGCIAADTFYLKIYTYDVNQCGISYRIKYDILPPVYQNDVEPNNNFSEAEFLPANVAMDGHLGFKTYPGASLEDDYYRVVIPNDGTLRIFTNAESPGGFQPSLALSLFTKSFNWLGDVYPGIGTYSIPSADTFLYGCFSADTFYLKMATYDVTQCGISYRIRYDIISSPTFGNDLEPNNNFASANYIPMNTNADGHLNFYGFGNEDFYKFYKADTGYTKLYVEAESFYGSSATVNIGFFDKNQGYMGGQDFTADSLGGAVLDSIFLPFSSPDTFYLRATWNNMNCGAYRLRVVTPTTVSGINEAPYLSLLSVFPNPSDGNFTIKFHSARNKQVYLQLRNVLGESVVSFNIQTTAGENQFQLNELKLWPGIYFLEMSDSANYVFRKSIIIQ